MNELVNLNIEVQSSLTFYIFKHLLPLAVLFFVILTLFISSYKKQNINFQSLVICFLYAMTILVFSKTLTYLFIKLYHSILFFSGDLDSPNAWRSIFLFAHIFFAMGCTFLGPLLFLKPYRDKHPKYHRLIGKIYVFGTLLSAVLVLPLSTTNVGGTIPRICFTVMAILWGGFTYTAYCYARRKNFVEHRRWAMRSYAMTLAFVHVNLTYKMLGVYVALGEFPLAVKIMQSFVSWASNLLIVEIYLAATTFKGRFVGKKKWFENLFSKEKFHAIKHLKVLVSKN